MKKRVHVFYAGRVQGVGFRATAGETARHVRVSGWVKNLRDGRVELVAEGEEKSLAKFLNELRSGPMHNFIQNIEITWEMSLEELKDFDIRY